jgi:hypothetical protein
MSDGFIKWLGDKAFEKGAPFFHSNEVNFDYADFLGADSTIAQNRNAFGNLLASLSNEQYITYRQLDGKYTGPHTNIKLHTAGLTPKGVEQYHQILEALQDERTAPTKIGF